jgi:hypothetical protein
MIDAQKIEAYLARMSLPYREAGEGTWILDDEGDELPPIVVAYKEPLVVFECRVMEAPADAGVAYFKKLLELNVADMTAGAYGLDQGWVVVSDALQAENLDYNEFQGAVDGIVMAISAHYPTLKNLQQ